MLPLLRIERKQKNYSNPFRIRIFLFLSYSFGIETMNTFIHSVVPAKTNPIPDQNGLAHTYMAYIKEYPPPRPLPALCPNIDTCYGSCTCITGCPTRHLSICGFCKKSWKESKFWVLSNNCLCCSMFHRLGDSGVGGPKLTVSVLCEFLLEPIFVPCRG